MKIYECAICKGFVKKGLQGEELFKGTRKDVRKHLVEVHHIKGQNNFIGLKKEELESKITKNTIAEVWE